MKTLKKSLFAVLAAFISLIIFSSFVACSNDNNDDDKETTTTNKEEQTDSENKTYFGTRAPTESKAVGDIVFSDGSATPYSEDLVLTSAQKSAAVAVIFYAGSVREILGQKILGVGLVNSQGEQKKTLMWAAKDTTGYSTTFTDIQCNWYTSTPTDSSVYYKYTYRDGVSYKTGYVSGDFDGSDNWTKICATDTNASETAMTNYPIFNWVNNYAATNLLTGNYDSGWYLPSIVELHIIYDNKELVNAAIEKTGGVKIENEQYWSSSEEGITIFHYAEYVNFSDGSISTWPKNYSRSVCAIREF
ncbi:MAG: DUF1566 domain-containing protein [Treponema sp.]|nr:DUF1566 domain-containing protein [Treponema sp.]